MRLPRLGAMPAAFVLISLIGLIVWTTQPNPIRENAVGDTRLQTDQERFDQEIEERLRAIRKMQDELSVIALDMAKGKLTLLEAASKTRDLHRDDPEILSDNFRLRYPTMSEAERHCREIIQFLPRSLPGGPVFQTLFAQYEAELQRHLECGTLRLEDAAFRADHRDL